MCALVETGTHADGNIIIAYRADLRLSLIILDFTLVGGTSPFPNHLTARHITRGGTFCISVRTQRRREDLLKWDLALRTLAVNFRPGFNAAGMEQVGAAIRARARTGRHSFVANRADNANVLLRGHSFPFPRAD